MIISQSRLFITMIFAPLALAMTPLLPLSIHQSGSRPTLNSFRGHNIHSHHRRALKPRKRCEEIITSLRGGSDGGGDSGNNNNNPIGSSVPETAAAASPYQQPTQLPPSPPPQSAATTTANNGGEFIDVLGANNDPMYGYRETVEDRIDAWRRQQQHKQQTQSAAEAASAVDEQGRFKLFTTVSKVSVSFFFFILMWRTVHHYELADATFGPTGRMKSGGFKAFLVRTIVLSPLVVLFLGEMMGAILGISGGGGGQSHATKKRLKGVLNLHKGVELIMMAYNIIRLAIFPSKYTIREVYIGRTISNFFFLMQCQLYTKLSWDDVSQSTSGEYVYESYYDDYTPEMESEYSSYGYAETAPQQNEYYQQNENDGYAAEEGQQNQQYYPQQ